MSDERGKRAETPGIIDDASGYFFDLGYTIGADGKIKFYDCALCKEPEKKGVENE